MNIVFCFFALIFGFLFQEPLQEKPNSSRKDSVASREIALPQASPKLEYVCTIPEGLPESIELTDKSGKDHSLEYHELFSNYHKLGWYGSIKYFSDTGLLDYRGAVICNWQCQRDSLEIGIAEATSQLRRLRLVHGQEKLKEIVDGFVKKEKKTIGKLFPEDPEFSR